MRFLFVDRILEYDRGTRILASKAISAMDTYLNAHYPLRPVVPSTLLIECLAQTGGWLNLISRDFRVKTVLVLVEGVRIHRPARPGDTLLLDARVLYTHADGVTVRGVARVGQDVVAEVERILLAHEPTDDAGFRAERLLHLRYLNERLLPAEE